MKQFDFNDNKIINYTPLEPTSPQMMFVPTEESAAWSLQNYKATQTTSTVYQTGISQKLSAVANYVGISTIDIPHIIDPDFTDFKISNQTITNEDLFTNDGDQKILMLGNKIQLLEIPKDRFKNSDTGEYNYGVYYLQIQPKCVTTTIKSIVQGTRNLYSSINTAETVTNLSTIRTTYYNLDKIPFSGTTLLWDFGNALYLKQKGRLLGSVVEVYDSNGKLKTTRFVTNDDINTYPDSRVELSPNYIGYESPQHTINIGDIVKIYPRETYFNPITLTLNFQSLNNTVYGLVQFMKNDVARDITTNVYEIYDDNGLSVSAEGNVDGKVVQSYQIQQVGNKELRKNLKI